VEHFRTKPTTVLFIFHYFLNALQWADSKVTQRQDAERVSVVQENKDKQDDEDDG
jgi:hypothetical protein